MQESSPNHQILIYIGFACILFIFIVQLFTLYTITQILSSINHIYQAPQSNSPYIPSSNIPSKGTSALVPTLPIPANVSMALDLKRVTNLNSLSAAVNVYAEQHHGQLPTSLQAPELTTYGDIFSFTDPQTNKPIDYHITSPDMFILCETFSNDSVTDYNDTTFLNRTFAVGAPHMSYKKGYSCVPFTLTITQADYRAAGEAPSVGVSTSP